MKKPAKLFQLHQFTVSYQQGYTNLIIKETANIKLFSEMLKNEKQIHVPKVFMIYLQIDY